MHGIILSKTLYLYWNLSSMSMYYVSIWLYKAASKFLCFVSKKIDIVLSESELFHRILLIPIITLNVPNTVRDIKRYRLTLHIRDLFGL